jgi:hypothetical protein
MQQTDPSGEIKKENRQRVSEALLVERLGLGDEWQDPGNFGDLPTRLPPSGWYKPTKAESFDLKQSIEQLGTLGCDRRVLYWCLWQMSHAANKVRMGSVHETVAKQGEDDRDLVIVKRPLVLLCYKVDSSCSI